MAPLSRLLVDMVADSAAEDDQVIADLMAAAGAVAPVAPWGSVRWPTAYCRDQAVDAVVEHLHELAMLTAQLDPRFEHVADLDRLILRIDWRPVADDLVGMLS